MVKLILLLITVLLTACSIAPTNIKEAGPLLPNHAPLPDIKLHLENLGSCIDTLNSEFSLNSNYPVAVFVHGRNSSVDEFSALAQLYQFHGLQTVCFNYPFRDSLLISAEELAFSLHQLISFTHNKNITVLGHSLGGLIARKALEDGLLHYFDNMNIKLVTVATPFLGVEAAQYCGSDILNKLSLGIIPGICWGISGDNWSEITANSGFIKYPQPLSPSVQRHLKVVTNEQDRCRRKNKQGTCVESDSIFELSEQYNPIIDNYPNVTNVQVDAGHAEIIGSKWHSPVKLFTILQQENMIPAYK